MQPESNTVILGIDPGTVVLGYGLIQVVKGTPALLEMGVLRLNSDHDHPKRLQKIFAGLEEIILKYHPDSMALEAPFFGKNVQSMLKLGRAQGVAMAAGMMHQLRVAEYSPRTVKQAVTGKGSASKEAVRAMLEMSLHFRTSDRTPMDATDALAVALCHHYTEQPAMILSANTLASTIEPTVAMQNLPGKISPQKSSRKKNAAAWDHFLQAHPERLA